MRSILSGLVLVLLPSLASAECQCVCVRGKSIPICRPQSLVEPICQQVCVDKIEQSLGPVGGSGGAGALAGGSLGLGGGVGMGVGTEAATGVGINAGDAASSLGASPLSGTGGYERSQAIPQLGR